MAKLIPIISSLLYLGGGQYNKWLRWLMGLPIALLHIVVYHNYVSLLCIVTYWIATSAFPYGEKSWLNFAGELGKFAICGFIFGLASMPALGVFWGYMQAIVSCVAFIGIKKWDDAGLIKNPTVELLRGGIGTIVFFIA